MSMLKVDNFISFSIFVILVLSHSNDKVIVVRITVVIVAATFKPRIVAISEVGIYDLIPIVSPALIGPDTFSFLCYFFSYFI